MSSVDADCEEDSKLSAAAISKSSSSSETTRSKWPWKKKKYSFAEREIAERIYYHTVDESEGFDLVPNLDLDCDLMGYIRPCSLNKEAIKAADFAIKEYNKKLLDDEEVGGGNCLILVKIVKLNMQLVAGLMLYMTLEARKRSEKKTSFYEARVYLGIKDHIGLQLFRPAMHYN